jgi:hypothetical protein
MTDFTIEAMDHYSRGIFDQLSNYGLNNYQKLLVLNHTIENCRLIEAEERIRGGK